MKSFTSWVSLRVDAQGNINTDEGAEVKVYDSGTATLSSIFEDSAGLTPIVQPLITNTFDPLTESNPGRFTFFVADGDYDIKINENLGVKNTTTLPLQSIRVSSDQTKNNTTNISTNTTDISSNTSNISDNTTDISTNTTNIGDNTTDISTNTGNISTNTDDIETLKEDNPNNQTGTSYTAQLSDKNKTIWMDNASANVVTIPDNTAQAFDINTVILIMMDGAGTTSITAGTGVTLNGVSTGSVDISEQYSGATIVKRGTNDWVVTGKVGAVT